MNRPCQWFLDTGCILEPPGQLKNLALAHTQTSKCLKASMVDSDVQLELRTALGRISEALVC